MGADVAQVLDQLEAEHQHFSDALAQVEKVLEDFPFSPGMVARRLCLVFRVGQLAGQIHSYQSFLS